MSPDHDRPAPVSMWQVVVAGVLAGGIAAAALWRRTQEPRVTVAFFIAITGISIFVILIAGAFRSESIPRGRALVIATGCWTLGIFVAALLMLGRGPQRVIEPMGAAVGTAFVIGMLVLTLHPRWSLRHPWRASFVLGSLTFVIAIAFNAITDSADVGTGSAAGFALIVFAILRLITLLETKFSE